MTLHDLTAVVGVLCMIVAAGGYKLYIYRRTITNLCQGMTDILEDLTRPAKRK